MDGTEREGFPPSPEEVLVLLRRYPILVAGAGALCALLALLWVGRQTPVWSAQAVCLLQVEGRPQDAAAAPLHAMVQNPDVATELARLQARGPALETVRPAADALAKPGYVHLGLTTQVDDESLSPLASFVRQLLGGARLDGRLSARAVERSPGAPNVVRVAFVDASLVRLSLPGRMGWDRDVELHRWSADAPIEYRGLDLHLEVEGNVKGKSFLIRRHQEREAVRAVMERLQAKESEPASGVLHVSYSDSDPHRAAEIVNALLANYLALHEHQAREQVRLRVEQVEGELERIRSELRRAYDELVELQQTSPLSIHSEESARFLTLNLTSRSVEYTSAQLELSLIEQAMESLGRGELAGLSRLAEKSTDTLTRALISQIGELQTSAELQGRADAGSYKHMLQQRQIKLREAREDLTEQRAGLIDAVAAMEESGHAAIGRLQGAGPRSLALDPASSVLVDTLARLSVRRSELLAGDYLPEHPEVVAVDAALERNLTELQGVLSGRIEVIGGQLEYVDGYLEGVEADLERHPVDERQEIASAIERFRLQALDHLTSLRDARHQAVRLLEQDIDRFETSLAQLPGQEKRQLSSLQRVENAKRRVADLLETRDTVRMRSAFIRAPAEVVDPAAPAARRDSPRLSFTVMLGLVLGLLFGVTLAYLHDWARGTFFSAEELEQALGLPSLARLPALALGTGEEALRTIKNALASDPQGRLASAFRELRTNLGVLLAVREDARVLGVTSTITGEGKTITAFGLAAALAGARQRVLLIDATGALDGGSGDGLVQALEAGGRQVLRRCGVEGLDILLAGGSTAALADALDGSRRKGVLRSLARQYDTVIVDLPALDRSGEVLSIARHVGALVIVCRQGAATRRSMRSVLAGLDRLGLPILGTVFNRASRGGLPSTMRGLTARVRARRAA